MMRAFSAFFGAWIAALGALARMHPHVIIASQPARR